MTSASMRPETAIDGAVFEIERFEWAAPNRIELAGLWTGVRGRRFIRPTLVLHAGDERRRLLALLDHKPWSADDGVEWIAAFAWAGEPLDVESAELHVASGIDLELPPPTRADDKRRSRRFPHRAVARDVTRDGADPTPAPAPVQPTASPEREPLRGELDAALQRAAVAERRAEELQNERDAAVAGRKSLAAELGAARHAHEEAVRAARRDEREAAGAMLAEGAELRASLERQRKLAFDARDTALHERDEAVRAMENAIDARKRAMADRKEAFRERDKALADRDWALREREQALRARDKALQERDAAKSERDDAVSERDTIVSVHKRGLPVIPPQPRHLPTDPARSGIDVWLPRAFAAGAIVLALIVVVRLIGQI